jgi:hypothetical protein
VIAAGVTTVAALLGIAAWDVIAPGVLLVRLRNVGEETLHAVEVASVFSAVELGDLQPGRAKLLRVPRLGEGNLWVRFRTAAGTADSAEVQVYVMKESKGYVSVQLDGRAGARWQSWMLPPWDF